MANCQNVIIQLLTVDWTMIDDLKVNINKKEENEALLKPLDERNPESLEVTNDTLLDTQSKRSILMMYLMYFLMKTIRRNKYVKGISFEEIPFPISGK